MAHRCNYECLWLFASLSALWWTGDSSPRTQSNLPNEIPLSAKALSAHGVQPEWVDGLIAYWTLHWSSSSINACRGTVHWSDCMVDSRVRKCSLLSVHYFPMMKTTPVVPEQNVWAECESWCFFDLNSSFMVLTETGFGWEVVSTPPLTISFSLSSLMGQDAKLLIASAVLPDRRSTLCTLVSYICKSALMLNFPFLQTITLWWR